jgi:hypothetical protein
VTEAAAAPRRRRRLGGRLGCLGRIVVAIAGATALVIAIGLIFDQGEDADQPVRGLNAGRAESFFGSLGKQVEWVRDAPGLVLGRIVCQLVNEACFALAEGVGSAPDVDTALRLGFNYPRGPLEWADVIELDHVLATLDALYHELHEERYRAAPLMRRMVAELRLGRSTGEGFFAYD